MLLKIVLFAFLATAVYAGPLEYLKEAVIKECNANNATDKVEQVKILMDEYIECNPKMIHLEELIAEFNETRDGTVEVARKYCIKAAQTKVCLAKYNQAATLCSKADLKDVVFRIEAENRGVDYSCYVEDGKTRLAKFVEDGGIRCFTSHVKLSHCTTTTSADMKAYLENMSRCVIDQMKACSNPAAILLQAMFDYIWNERPSSGNNELV